MLEVRPDVFVLIFTHFHTFCSNQTFSWKCYTNTLWLLCLAVQQWIKTAINTRKCTGQLRRYCLRQWKRERERTPESSQPNNILFKTPIADGINDLISFVYCWEIPFTRARASIVQRDRMKYDLISASATSREVKHLSQWKQIKLTVRRLLGVHLDDLSSLCGSDWWEYYSGDFTAHIRNFISVGFWFSD